MNQDIQATVPRRAWPSRPAGDIDLVCPCCGSEELRSVKCKLMCDRCHSIVATCCEF